VIQVAPGAEFEATTDEFPAGLEGTLGIRLVDAAGGTVIARDTDDVAQVLAVGAGALYSATLSAPDERGQYWLVWDDDADELRREELLVSFSAATPGDPDGRDLCTLADVLRYVPGYESDPETDLTLQELITSVSVDAYEEIGREFVSRDEPGTTRVFPIEHYDVEERELSIGDATSIATVEIRDARGNVLQTVPDASYVLLPRSRDAWQPITELEFPIDVDDPAQLALTRLTAGIYYDPGTWLTGRRAPERLLHVTADWGFPQIPRNVRESVAKLVIVRYVTDVTAGGTAFTDALDNINIAGLFRSANESLLAYRWVEVG
jgi:hypothetical protein